LLSAKLRNDILDATAAHTHAGTYRIYIGIIGVNGYLGPAAGLPDNIDDLDNPFSNLRHLSLEKLGKHGRCSTRKKYLGTFCRHPDIGYKCLDPVTLPVHLTRGKLLVVEDRLNTAEVDNKIAFFKSAHKTIDKLADTILELVENGLALSLTDPLDDDLLCGLGSYAGKLA